MYDFNNRQFVFKQSDGSIWNFYHDDKLGLCYSRLTKRNTWTEPVSIQKNVHPSFYADIDFEDCFHILAQDKQGNLHYTRMRENDITTIPVLNSKTPSSYNKHLHLVPFKNSVHLFFVLQHNNQLILAHQVVSDSTAATPRVIDYVSSSICPFSAFCDRSGNIYIFYQSSDGKYLQLGYKKFIPSQKFWSEFTPVTKYNGDSEFPRFVVDARNIIHLCYQRTCNKQYELVYQQKVPDRNMWSGETIIHTSLHSFEDSSIVSINDNLIVYWVRDDIIYCSSSGNNGSTWTRASRYAFPAGKQLVCMVYRTNIPQEDGRVICRDIPGSFINGLKLAFYHDVSADAYNLSPEDLKIMIVDSLRLLKGNVEELKESLAGLKDEMLNLNTMQQSLEREMVKYSVKLNMLQNEMNQAKSSMASLDAYKGTLGEFMAKVETCTAELNDIKNRSLQGKNSSEPMVEYITKLQHLEEELNCLKNVKTRKVLRLKKIKGTGRFTVN